MLTRVKLNSKEYVSVTEKEQDSKKTGWDATCNKTSY